MAPRPGPRPRRPRLAARPRPTHIRWLALVAGLLALSACSRLRGGEGAAVAHPAEPGGVRLVPDPAYAASRLEVVFDDTGTRREGYRYAWRRDGAIVPGAHGPVLEPGAFAAGQTVEVTVTLEDPATGRLRTWSDATAILNTPPRVADVALALEPSAGGTEVRVRVEASDADGDPVSNRIRWFRNGAAIEDVDGPALAGERLARGDRLAVEVVASDGRDHSAPARSRELRIENLPPRITSRPVAPRAGDGAFRYRVAAEDPDGDPLHFALLAGPPGMRVDADGLVAWTLPADADPGETIPVRVVARDPHGGEALQEFSIRLPAR